MKVKKPKLGTFEITYNKTSSLRFQMKPTSSYSISWVFENYFKQIQNQQEAGIQDGIRSPCSQIVSQNL